MRRERSQPENKTRLMRIQSRTESIKGQKPRQAPKSAHTQAPRSSHHPLRPQATPNPRHPFIDGTTSPATERESRVTDGGGGSGGRRGSRLLEAPDRDAGGDGGGPGAAGLPRPVRAPPHPAQQVPRRRVLPPLEVRARAPRLREVRVRARHGADAQDAEDPRGAGDQGQGRRIHWPHPGHRKAHLIRPRPDPLDLGLLAVAACRGIVLCKDPECLLCEQTCV